MKDVAWIDRNYKHYKMEEITDEHLVKILEFIDTGGGYRHFLTAEKIHNLHAEAVRRGLK